MKRLQQLSLTILSVILLFAACKKDDEPSINQAEEYYLNAKIDGVDFSTTNVLVSAMALESEFYTITGITDDGNAITLTMEGPPETGTFVPSGGDDFTSLFYSQTSTSGTWFAFEDMGSGSITINNIGSASISGSFSFIGEMVTDTSSVKNITEGSFNARRL